jgi:Carboxypeptidase regulatory-like domain
LFCGLKSSKTLHDATPLTFRPAPAAVGTSVSSGAVFDLPFDPIQEIESPQNVAVLCKWIAPPDANGCLIKRIGVSTTLRRFLAILFLISVGCLRPDSANACSCAGPGAPCAEAWRADAVFVGNVVSISSTAGRRVELAVIEPFRGFQLSQVIVETGAGGGDCGYPFEIGQSYLVYAHRTPEGHLTTSICSRTRPARAATEDLAYLRSLADIVPGAQARLTGRVVLNEYPVPAGSELKTVPRIGVVATDGGRTFSASTDERGEFALTGLPLGTYEVVASAPDGYEGSKRSVTINDPRGCGTTDLSIRYDGRVSGRVVDSRGGGVPGLALDLVLPAEVDRLDYRRKHVEARTAADGTFEMRLVQPDTYFLTVTFAHGENSQLTSPHVLYPGVIEPSEARRVVVSEGGRVALQNFAIPEVIKLVTVTGVVVDEAGQPVRGATLIPRAETLVPRPNTNPFILGPAFTTGDDGRFAFSLVENGKYDVHATRYVGTAPYIDVQTEIVPFTATAGGPTLRIVMKPNRFK